MSFFRDCTLETENKHTHYLSLFVRYDSTKEHFHLTREPIKMSLARTSETELRVPKTAMFVAS